MSSRLDRLFVLLETGSSAATRRAAARQLGEVQRARPTDLPRLLARLARALRSACWDTRTAAGAGVEAVLGEAGPAWGGTGEVPAPRPGTATLAQLDLPTLLSRDQFLGSSEGSEFDCSGTGLAAQRQQLDRQLGLDKLGLGSRDLGVGDEDLAGEQQQQPSSAGEILAAEVAAITGQQQLSARETNRLKRKAKQEARAAGRRAEDNQAKRPKTEPTVKPEAGVGPMGAEMSMQQLYDQLVGDLVSARWETRHGAAIGLRELLRSPAGRVGGPVWLEELLVRLVTTLALDRFGDFVGDTVVCPVVESVGQAVGVGLDLATHNTVLGLAGLVDGMATSEAWHTRHAAMVLARYLLSVRTDAADSLVPALYPACRASLQVGFHKFVRNNDSGTYRTRAMTWWVWPPPPCCRSAPPCPACCLMSWRGWPAYSGTTPHNWMS